MSFRVLYCVNCYVFSILCWGCMFVGVSGGLVLIEMGYVGIEGLWGGVVSLVRKGLGVMFVGFTEMTLP